LVKVAGVIIYYTGYGLGTLKMWANPKDKKKRR